MIWKTVLILATLLAAGGSVTRAEVQANSSGRANPPSTPAALPSLYTSPMEPHQCRLGGRRFGCDAHPVTKRRKMHSGWDFQARPRGTPVLRAIGEGTVIKAGRLSDKCGDGVQIKLKSGLYAYYCHMSRVEKLKPGLGELRANHRSDGPERDLRWPPLAFCHGQLRGDRRKMCGRSRQVPQSE